MIDGRMNAPATAETEIQALTRDLRAGRCAVEVGVRALALFAALALAVRGPWFTWPLSFFAVGILQGHFLVLSHEAQHKLLARSPRWNDWIGKWLLAYPFGQTFLSERARHMKHHRTAGSPDDPDYHRYVLDDKRPWHDMIWYYVRLATYGKVWEYVASAEHSAPIDRPAGEADGRSRRELIVVAVVQGAVLAAFWWVASPWHYVAFWLAPLVVVTTTISEFREFCEHVSTPSSPLTLKSFRAPLWQQHLLAPVGFSYHAEHHLHPSVPHYLLPRVAAHYPVSTTEMEVHRSHLDVVRLCRNDVIAAG
jgi:fatty acid desaturase